MADNEDIKPPDSEPPAGRRELSEEEKNMLRRAETVIAGMTEQYQEIAAQDVSQIEEAVAELEGEPGGHPMALKRIFDVAHDMKGQGETFGYPMITVIGNQLCRFIETLSGAPNADELAVIKLHAKALRVVVAERIKTSDGETAKTLLGGLELVIQKIRG